MKSNLTRRDFGKLSMAALGGMVAGSALTGCGGDDKDKDKDKNKDKGGKTAATTDPTLLVSNEKHVCRGLNTCKGKGKGGANDCAGQGACATAKAHTCGGENDCKGQGGCQGTAGMNACKGKGGCHVPLSDESWAKVRAAFEEQMKKASKTVGAAPKGG